MIGGPALREVTRALADGRLSRVVLSGMGSSYHAAYPLYLALCRRGIACTWIESAELLLVIAAFRRPDTLLVLISQSGASAEIITLLEHAAGFGHVIGVTNEQGSPLAQVAANVLYLGAGKEATVSCKTYVATLAMLSWLGVVLLGDETRTLLVDLVNAHDEMERYLERWRHHLDDLIPLCAGVRSIFVTGRAESLATAGTGGLILKEATRCHAEGMSAAAFRHGPLEMADGQVLALVCAGEPPVAKLHHRLVLDILAGGSRAALIGPGEDSPEVFRLPLVPAVVRPLLEILPVQMLSLALAARDGREAGRFERASKITSIA